MLRSHPSLAACAAALVYKHSALSMPLPQKLSGRLVYSEGLSDPLLDDDLGSRAMATSCLCSSQMMGWS